MTLPSERLPDVLDALEQETRGLDLDHRNEEDADASHAFNEFDVQVKRALARGGYEAFYDSDAAWRAFSGCMWDSEKGKVSFLNRNGDLISTTMKNYIDVDAAKTFGHLILPQEYERIYASASANERSSLKKLAHVVRTDYGSLIRTYRQANLLNVQVDMFAKQPSIRVHELAAHVTLTFENLEGKVRNRRANEALLDLYASKHFPEFYSFLDFVVAARFAVDRRRAFLWMHKQKDWGKGFLLDCLRELGLVFEVSAKEIDKAFAGNPVGINSAEALRAWILFVDEFKTVISELKQLNNHVMLSPKFQMRARMPVYAKVFASAESVPSLVSDGVEGQFADRFSLLASEEGDMPLSRLFTTEADNLQFFDAVVRGAARHLDMRVREYRELGKESANSRANAAIADWRRLHAIDLMYSSLDDFVEEHAGRVRTIIEDWARWGEALDEHETKLQELKDVAKRCCDADREAAQSAVDRHLRARPREPEFLANTRELREVLQRHALRAFVKTSMGKVPAVVIRSPVLLIEKYLEAAIGDKTRGKVAYKTPQIIGHLCDIETGDRGRFSYYHSLDAERGVQVTGIAMTRKF